MEPVTVIIETPRGSSQKFDYNKKLKAFKLNKVLSAGMAFPFDFGFIPDTKGGDGDPLDVIVIAEFETFTGCAMDCRIIGAIVAEQTERDGRCMRNDRFLGVPVESAMFENLVSITQLPEKFQRQLQDFFRNYNEASGKKFKILDVLDAADAYKLISAG